MKKKILGAVAIGAIVAMTAFNMNFTADNNEFSALTMSNVEALANKEGPDKTTGTVYPCHIYVGGQIAGFGNTCGGSNSSTCYSNPCT